MSIKPENFTPDFNEELLKTLPKRTPLYVRHLIRHLLIVNQQSEVAIQQLKAEVQDLKAQLSKNSSNSHKPPSSDGFRKIPKSLRESSGKKVGGQEGHKGAGRSQVSHPDHTFLLSPDRCQHCHAHLHNITGRCVEKRQVFELPQPKIETTEYQAIEKTCLRCGRLTRASFPEHVKGPVQFGSRVKALASYLSSLHFIPINRVYQIFKDLLGISLSPGSCMNINTQLFTELHSFEEGLKKDLLSSKVLHFDETGMRCEKKLKWIHGAASPDGNSLYDTS